MSLFESRWHRDPTRPRPTHARQQESNRQFAELGGNAAWLNNIYEQQKQAWRLYDEGSPDAD